MAENNDYFDDLLAADAVVLLDGLGLDGEQAEPEITARAMRRRLKQDVKELGRRGALRDLLKEIPPPGEQLHIISKGLFNFWTYCPIISELLARPIEKLYCATWMVNAQGVKECLKMIDAGLVRECYWIVGKYLKNRDPAIFYQLATGIQTRGAGFVKAIENHAKLMLIEAPPCYLSITGSANMSENKRAEATQVVNDFGVYKFYQEFFNEARGEAW